MITKKVIFPIISLLVIFSLNAQTNKDYDWRFLYNDQLLPNTAEAKLLIKNIDYPIDYSSGTVNINIPLFEIESRGVNLPLSINYVTKGIKFEEKNGLIGIGWKLNVAGSIVRVVKGLPDDCSFQNWRSSELITSTNNTQPLREIDEGLFDSEWDYFYYSFGNFSGKFIFNENTGEITQFPLTKNRINKTSNGFIITTPDGIKYFFEEKESMDIVIDTESITRAVNNLGEGATGGTFTAGLGESTICYHLSKITSLNGYECIKFKYKTNPSQVTTSDKRINSNNTSFFQKGMRSELFFGDTEKNADYVITNSSSTRSNNKNKLIDRIEFNNGFITFTTFENKETFSPYMTLSEIKLYNNNDNDPIKTITFNHDNFTAQGGAKTKRLRLNRLTITGKNNALINEYSFNYYTDYLLPDLDVYVPSYSQDKYGFYNGKNNSSPFYIILKGGDRSSNFNYIQSLSLKTIQQKHGQEVNLYYEPKTYDGDTIGLRVKRIEEIDLISSTNKITLLEYTGASAYNFRTSIKDEDFFDKKVTYNGLQRCYETVISYYPYPKIPGVNIADNEVIYKEVVEKKVSSVNPEDTLKVKYEFNPIQYQFINNPIRSNPDIDMIPLISGYFLPNVWEKSHLHKKTSYKYVDSEYIPVESITNDYKIFNFEYKQTGLHVRPRNYYDSNYKYANHPNVSDFNYFDILAATGWNLPVSTTKEIYTENGVIMEKSSYKYDNLNDNSLYRGLLMEETKIVNGKTLKKKYTYPNLYGDVIAFNLSQSDANSILCQNNVLTPIRISHFVDNKNTLTTTLVHDIYNPLNKGRKAFPYLLMQERDSVLLKATVFKRYDEFGNPIELKDSLSGLNTTMLWGYKGEYPIAEIQNATNRDVANALSGTSLEQLSVLTIPDTSKVETLRTTLPAAHITTYTHSPLVGLLSEKSPRKIKNLYNYDNVGRLFSIKDNNDNFIAKYTYGFAETFAGAPIRTPSLIYWNNPSVFGCGIMSIHLFDSKTYGNIPQPPPIYSVDVSDVGLNETKKITIQPGTYCIELVLSNDYVTPNYVVTEAQPYNCIDVTGLDYGYISNVKISEYLDIRIYISGECK